MQKPTGSSSAAGEVRAPLSFVALMATIMSLVALSTDAMLPALNEVASDLGAAEGNSRQLVIITLFLGLGIGQLVFGPLSDTFGRKPVIYVGLALFIIGSILSAVATSMTLMIVGRVLQGIGAGSPRVVSTAIVRDRYKGDAMASIVSLMMVIFILVPMLAPGLGQLIVLVSHWRMIFVVFALLAVFTTIWFWRGLGETLKPEDRRPFNVAVLKSGIGEVVTTPQCMGYLLASSAISGAFLAFLSSSQQIMQEQYGLGSRFAIYFAALAFSYGAASFCNSKLVMRFGMRQMSSVSLKLLVLVSILYVLLLVLYPGDPGLWVFMVFMAASAFAVAITFGNFNALAMEPMGHLAGIASSIIGALGTLIALVIASVISGAYNGTSLPLALGYLVTSAIALYLMYRTEKQAQTRNVG